MHRYVPTRCEFEAFDPFAVHSAVSMNDNMRTLPMMRLSVLMLSECIQSNL